MRPLVTLQHIILTQGSHGFRVHTLLCRGSSLPVQFLVSPANCHDAPFARPLLELAVRFYHIHPPGCRLLRPATHPLDPRHPGCHCRDALESQATKEPLVLATNLEAREELGLPQFH